MSYLQSGHVEKSFYERTTKSYLDTDNTSFLDRENKTFLNPPTETYLSGSTDSFLTNTYTSHLTPSNTSFLTNTADSYITSTNQSFLENSNTDYLSSVAPLANSKYLLTDNINHVEADYANHLQEDKQDHLEESGGETSDEAAEDFSHAIDWSLIVPPLITPIFANGATKYKCELTNKIHNSMPIIPERFDVFDFNKQQLIITIARYHTQKGNNIQGKPMTPKRKYAELNRKKSDLHSTELQSIALENLRVWKHKKEQELLGQINIQNADYSDRTERMGVGDHSAGGAAERKRKRELLKKKQEDERQRQLLLKQRLKQESNIAKQNEILQTQKLAQQRKQQQMDNVYSNMSRKQKEDYDRQQRRLKEQEEKQLYVKIESKNISHARKQQKDQEMLYLMEQKRDDDMVRAQQRNKYLEEKTNYVKIESKNVSRQRKQEIENMMRYGLEQKYNDAEGKRRERKDEHDVFMDNLQKSQEDMRQNMQQQRSERLREQEAERKRREQEMERQRRMAEQEASNKENERRKKMRVKEFVTRINNLLDVKSVGIDFDEFPNEFYFKYNTNWDPQGIMGYSDLDDILRSNGLGNTVEIIRSGMTKRAILRKHYQKIKIVSRDTNDILTVLAISDNIDGAIGQLRAMQRQKVNEEKEQERQNKWNSPRGVTPAFGGQVDYSANNNWGLPRGYRVKKTAKGRMFFINDATKQTSWDDPRPMPRGWRGGKTPQGKKFYINDSTKQTTWNDPRPKIYV
eukprot:150175_1